MENKSKVSLVTGAAIAFFSAVVTHAADLAQTQDLTGTVLVANNDKEESCGHEGGCKGGEGKKAHEGHEGHEGHHGAKKAAVEPATDTEAGN